MLCVVVVSYCNLLGVCRIVSTSLLCCVVRCCGKCIIITPSSCCEGDADDSADDLSQSKTLLSKYNAKYHHQSQHRYNPTLITIRIDMMSIKTHVVPGAVVRSETPSPAANRLRRCNKRREALKTEDVSTLPMRNHTGYPEHHLLG